MTHSRRSFLKYTSAAAALGMLTQLPGRRLWAARRAELTPDLDDAFLRELAQTAMAEAKKAGARFADIRINAARAIEASATHYRGGSRPHNPWPWVGFIGSFGVRAIVDGAWGFGGGHLLTPETVAEGARLAVHGARTNRPRRPRALELAPRPVVENGFWEMPIVKDPFTVPLNEQRDLMDAVLTPLASMPEVDSGSISVKWLRSTTVFAATDGSLVLQRLFLALPTGEVRARGKRHDWRTTVTLPVKGIEVGPYGYEALGLETLAWRVRETAERAIDLAKKGLNASSVEVGRYDLVFAPAATATLLATTVAEALSFSRVLGFEANGVGTSFAAPAADMLGKFQIGAPALTIHGDRTQPQGAATVGWDEEGVKPEAYTFVKDGVIVDYHADRQTATELAAWYRAQGQPVRAHGLARRTGDAWPVVSLPNLTMEPGRHATMVDDLIAATKRGFYIEACRGVSDQQVLNTQCGVGHTAVRRITNGKLGPNVRDFAFQFITPQFWKNLDGLGGPETAESLPMVTDMEAFRSNSQPFPYSTVRAVPMRVREVNVLNTGRIA